jgi:superfamily II DNA or RNA helicase
MDFKTLLNDPRNSIDGEIAGKISVPQYERLIRHLTDYRFWTSDRRRGLSPLWQHQIAGVSLALAYVCADTRLTDEGNVPEAALLKMPTGTGKSGVVAIIARCLPLVKKILVLTPRTALSKQMNRDISWRFWKRLGFDAIEKATFVADAKTAGAEIWPTEILNLLPTEAESTFDLAYMAERAVVIGTFQALDQIRADAEGSVDGHKKKLLDLLGTFDLVIVDEAHYEPAPSWSRAVRAFALPTILLSATPYRNDYKSFRVRGRYVFNFPFDEAVGQKIIRSVSFVTWNPNGASDVNRFTTLLKREVPKLLAIAAKETPNPKVIVHADEFAKVKLLQRKIHAAFGELPILIHHQIKSTDITGRRFHSVDTVREWGGWQTARFWIHESKLLEGIDDPSFVGVAMFDPFQNARQLVQQVGRALRSTDPDFKTSQQAFVLSLPLMDRALRASWDRYLQFERYAAVDPRRLVEAEGALPDRLLENLPDFQYVAGEFRPKFSPATSSRAADFRVPASATLFEVDTKFDLQRMAGDVEESLLAEDRFKPVRIAGLPGNAIGFAYYGWRTSPYLSLAFFPEWTLGLCLLVQIGTLLFVNDTGGIVFDLAEFGMCRPERLLLQKLLPQGTGRRPVRISRISTFSLDTSDRAIRSMSIRSRSIEDTFDLLDPVLVPTTTSGFIDHRARYVGFSRGRLSDVSVGPIPLPEYCQWVSERATELRSSATKQNVIFDRYAKVRGVLNADQATPLSILLDFDRDMAEFPFVEDEDSPAEGVIDADHDDLCADVNGGRFEITLGGRKYGCSAEFNEGAQRYKIQSDELDAAYPGRSVDGRSPPSPITAIFNREQSFRIIVAENGVIYAARRFYEPNLDYLRSDGSIPLLANVFSIPALARAESEKGENLFNDRRRWAEKSVFGIVHSILLGARSRAAWDRLYDDLRTFDIVVCDDDGEEIGDFLAIDQKRKKVALIHAKVGKGAQMSATELQAVGRQVLASLAFCSAVARAPKIKRNRWATRVNANGTALNLNRVFRNTERHTIGRIETIASQALADRSWNREIWILAGAMMSREVVEDAVKNNSSNRARQFLMYLESLVTGCGRANSTLKIYCS